MPFLCSVLNCYTALAWWHYNQWGMRHCLQMVGITLFFLIGWSDYRLGLLESQWVLVLRDRKEFTPFLTSQRQSACTAQTAGKCLPLGLCKETVKQSSIVRTQLVCGPRDTYTQDGCWPLLKARGHSLRYSGSDTTPICHNGKLSCDITHLYHDLMKYLNVWWRWSSFLFRGMTWLRSYQAQNFLMYIIGFIMINRVLRFNIRVISRVMLKWYWIRVDLSKRLYYFIYEWIINRKAAFTTSPVLWEFLPISQCNGHWIVHSHPIVLVYTRGGNIWTRTHWWTLFNKGECWRSLAKHNTVYM